MHSAHNYSLDSREIIRRLERDGWRLVRTRRSHRQYKHPDKPGLVTVPHPRRDFPIGTLRSILKQAGLTDFR
jgi:predicted RNA binding protein YcfA (HicA-like mRNA interferase family)